MLKYIKKSFLATNNLLELDVSLPICHFLSLKSHFESKLFVWSKKYSKRKFSKYARLLYNLVILKSIKLVYKL